MPFLGNGLLNFLLVQPLGQVLDLATLTINWTLHVLDRFLDLFFLRHLLSNILEVLINGINEKRVVDVLDNREEIVLAHVVVAVHVVQVEGDLL